MRIEQLDPHYAAGLLEGLAAERARESARMWRVSYGSVAEQPNHTLAYFGLIYTNAVAAEGYVWAQVGEAAKRLKAGDLRRGLRLWQNFVRDLDNWTLIAYCKHEERMNAHFIRWLGFRLAHRCESFKYYVRNPNGN